MGARLSSAPEAEMAEQDDDNPVTVILIVVAVMAAVLGGFRLASHIGEGEPEPAPIVSPVESPTP